MWYRKSRNRGLPSTFEIMTIIHATATVYPFCVMCSGSDRATNRRLPKISRADAFNTLPFKSNQVDGLRGRISIQHLTCLTFRLFA